VVAGVLDGREAVRELYTPSPTSYLLLIAAQRPDEEAVIDQGRTSALVNIHYETEALEGESVPRCWQRGHQPSAFSRCTKSLQRPLLGVTACAARRAVLLHRAAQLFHVINTVGFKERAKAPPEATV